MSICLKIKELGNNKESVLDIDFLANIIYNFPQIIHIPPLGNGTERSPYQLKNIGHWAWAAHNPTTQSVDLYLIAGHIIQRNPAGKFQDYVTDLVDAGKTIGTPLTDNDDFGRARFFPRSHDRVTPIYSVKYQRIENESLSLFGVMDDVQIARIFRKTLKGQHISPAVISEIPGSVASMFLSEVSRQPKMLLLGLMLIDLIEARQPIKGTMSTFRNAMYYTSDNSFQAMHPMFHANSVRDSKEMSWNSVWQKSINIVAAWFKYMFTKNNTFETILEQPSAKTNITGFMQNVKFSEGRKGSIRSEMIVLLNKRASHLERM